MLLNWPTQSVDALAQTNAASAKCASRATFMTGSYQHRYSKKAHSAEITFRDLRAEICHKLRLANALRNGRPHKGTLRNGAGIERQFLAAKKALERVQRRARGARITQGLVALAGNPHCRARERHIYSSMPMHPGLSPVDQIRRVASSKPHIHHPEGTLRRTDLRSFPW